MQIGGLITLLILLPNVFYFWASRPQVDAYEIPRSVVDGVMGGLERAGQLGSFVLPFFYTINITPASHKIAMVVMGIALVFYYICWGRYFLMGRQPALLYAPLAGIPLPMAISPILYFLAAAALTGSLLLAAAALVLAAGHLYVSQKEFLRLKNQATAQVL
jgi:hypothetical protein